ncbi:MAG TPA: folylpolyglutamate synthase/dihydrofolate synthase family protein [Gammaproteobacteria bacterium]|nr:folylpolyglutamate synthase/dihydrofolate synthase family protein [Gammaproteobacteria bacterium]
MRRFETLGEWLAWLSTLHPKQIDMSLERVSGVLERLDIADPPYEVIAVGGTNGKGSCVALLESIYLAAGYAVGAFTSPHLIAFNERIRFGGRDLGDAALIELFELMDAARGELTLSYFEASAVAAMLHFARAGADVAVLEVGMGGRLDAVNALDADAALIVSVDLDHMEYLGPDRDAIGREKAGIARPGRPVIVADREPPQGLLDEIARRGGEMRAIGADFSAEPLGKRFAYRAEGLAERLFPQPAFGSRIQLANAAAVVAVTDAMQARLPVADEQIATGLETARLRGRFERAFVTGGDRASRVEWVFDVAHNPAAAALFHEAVTGLDPVPRTIAVFGAMADKDIAAVVRPFVELVDAWFVGGLDSDRGADPEDLAALLRREGARHVSVYDDIGAAAIAAIETRADRALAFGSFYTVGPAMQAVGLY